jgi:hypothetical protein
MLAVAFLTPRQGCAQGATKLVPTEPAPASSAAPVKPTPRTMKQTYNAIYVAPLEIQKDVTFPPEYLALIQTEIFKELTSAKVFAEVVTEGQTASTPDAHPLRLTGLITNYNPGNRAKRYFGAGAAGAAEIDSKVSFVDATPGQTLMSQNLRAMLAGGSFGGQSEDAVKDHTPSGEQGEADAEHAPGAVVSSKPARHMVCHQQKDWPGSQKRDCEQEAEDGYRVVPAHRRDGGNAPVQPVVHNILGEPGEGHQQAGGGGFSSFATDAHCPSG